jgi:hypothetical protein
VLSWTRLRSGAATGKNREHRAAFHRGRAFYDRDVGHAGGDAPNLVTGNLGMCGFAASESHLDLDFVALLKETAGGPHPYLKIMVVGARAYPHFLDF